MGFEKDCTRLLGQMLLENTWTDQTNLPVTGTANHVLLSRACRVSWFLHCNNMEKGPGEVRGATEYLLKQDFMCHDQACEELTPSHSQWWLTGMLGLRLTCLMFSSSNVPGVKDLLQATGQWLLWHQSLCKIFATSVGIVGPGARAWPLGQSYNGRNKARDVVFNAINTGTVSKTWDPWEDNLDMVSVTFAKKLLERGDDFGGAKKANDIPKKLRWPIRLQSKDGDFVGYLTTINGNSGLTTQRQARWIGKKDSYAFDNDPETKLPGSTEKIIGG